MSCVEVQERILECFDGPETGLPEEAAAHVAGCASCAQFHAAQQGLHLALAQRYAPPNLSAGFQKQLAAKVKKEQRRQLWNSIPDLVHIGAGIAASVVCAAVIPLMAARVLGAGLAFTLFAYVVQTLVRLWLEEADEF